MCLTSCIYHSDVNVSNQLTEDELSGDYDSENQPSMRGDIGNDKVTNNKEDNPQNIKQITRDAETTFADDVSNILDHSDVKVSKQLI